MKIRRTFLYLPGNNPKMLETGGVFGSDVVILDLEDAVIPTEKDAARILVQQALRHVDYGKAEKAVRINSLDTFGVQDIRYIIPAEPDLIILPKVNCVEDILKVVAEIETAERQGQTPVKIAAIIETAQGLSEAVNIAKSHPRLNALILGAEDYVSIIGAQRTKPGMEIFMARAIIVNAAAAAGIQSFDAVFIDVNDDEGLIEDTLLSKQLGFNGKPAIHPRQVKIINDIFSPSAEEIALAQRIIEAENNAAAQGLGVTSLDGKMIDAPVANRAKQIICLAQSLGLIKEASKCEMQ